MENIIIGGTRFSTFIRNGERYLCTGSPTGEIKFAWAGEIADYCVVTGATSVVSGVNATVDELYTMWLDRTEFQREVLGITF